ncbi:hypothetical protein [Formosa sp. A9]|uniref:hypothetical protein n=1 Tax=Formosa sp. A9 TaxID=3442641 RepID=UPI003EB7371F
MSAIGGYSSDVNLNDLNYVGDFPVENSLGGFGVTTGGTDDYVLELDPALKNAYRQGLSIQVKFNHGNSGVSTININGKGAVPIMKAVNGVLVDLSADDLGTINHYLLLFDGTCFQIVAGLKSSIETASETVEGKARVATIEEVNEGTSNSTFVTPQKLASYVADKVTGLWENKGTIDCSTNPNYPAALAGDAYTVSTGGKIGGAAGEDVQEMDVIVCLVDNAGGDQASVGASWNVIQSNVSQATETIAGIIKVASQALVNGGTDDLSAITPLKLKTLLDSRLATETLIGLIEIATQAETDLGADNQRAITPLRLKTRLDNYLNRESLLTITAAQIGTTMYHTPGRNRYSVVNGNMILIKDIRLKRTGGIGSVSGWMMNFPKPNNSPTGALSGTLTSNKGETFFYNIDSNGRVSISGTFIDPNDELLFNIHPYIAKYPIEYDNTSPA